MRISEYEKQIIASSMEMARQNEWDDVMLLTGSEIMEMYPLADFEKAECVPDLTLRGLEIAELEALIDSLQQEVDQCEEQIANMDRSSHITEARSELSYYRRELVMAQERYDGLINDERRDSRLY